MDATGDMRAFVGVVEHQSFAAAAACLGPDSVGGLQARDAAGGAVGCAAPSPDHPSARRDSEGDVYFARARQILADIEEAEAEVARSRGAPRGHLRVNTSNAFGIHQLAPALPDFMTAFPTSRSISPSPIA